MDILLSNINERVTTMVNEYVNEVLQRVSKAHNIPLDQLKTHLESNVSDSTTQCVKTVHVVESESLMCSMKTKSGTQCKYKCMSGSVLCKKHNKLQENTTAHMKDTVIEKKTMRRLSKNNTKKPLPVTTSELPSDEQSWFEHTQASDTVYQQSYYPKSPDKRFVASPDSQIIDDTECESTYVLDE